MANVKEKAIWKFRLTGTAESHTRTKVTSRDVQMTIDEPIERGGTNEGPMPVEMVFAGLVGCTHVISNKLAIANNVEILSMDIDVVTTMDSRGTRLIEPVDVPFPDTVLTIKATMNGDQNNIETVINSLKEHCAVSKMLRQSGTKVTENWLVNDKQYTV
jgi:uncharacterized OsmC-like protein